VQLPFGGMKKVAVMALGQGLPLEHTFSCVAPMDDWHCGRCSKCGERRDAFADARMVDPTRYAR
jgi:7-cyano-7-deazaguanine synthase